MLQIGRRSAEVFMVLSIGVVECTCSAGNRKHIFHAFGLFRAVCSAHCLAHLLARSLPPSLHRQHQEESHHVCVSFSRPHRQLDLVSSLAVGVNVPVMDLDRESAL